MNHVTAATRPTIEDNDRIAAVVASQGPRLRAFVRRQIADLGEVEDIVQDTFVELVSAYRLMEPIEHVAAWLLRIARNRIIDRFRERSRRALALDAPSFHDAGPTAEPTGVLDEWFAPSAWGPEASYAREVLADELLAALDELPLEQREIFVAHELEGRSFKELAAELGIGVNTLLGRKHAAVRHLRQRLQDIHTEFDK
ncbi:MAG: RNA polymerase sigma factor [Steroidobacteraceae bacterium]|jgi:RNA polymerase sigma factor (sigma-70 family)